MQPDGLAQHPPDRLVDAGDLVRLQRAGGPQGVNAGAPQRLRGVDVPDPGDATLIQQERLDGRPPAAPQERAKPRDGE